MSRLPSWAASASKRVARGNRRESISTNSLPVSTRTRFCSATPRAIINRSRRADLAPHRLTAFDLEFLVNTTERPVPVPQVEIAEQSALRRQVLRHCSPLAACAENIKQAVENLAHVDLTPAAAALGGREESKARPAPIPHPSSRSDNADHPDCISHGSPSSTSLPCPRRIKSTAWNHTQELGRGRHDRARSGDLAQTVAEIEQELGCHLRIQATDRSAWEQRVCRSTSYHATKHAPARGSSSARSARPGSATRGDGAGLFAMASGRASG